MRIMTLFLKSKKIILFQKNYFKEVSSNEVKKIIKSLNRKTFVISSCVQVSILIESMDLYLPLLTDIITDFLRYISR